MEPVSVHIRRFRQQWKAALLDSIKACPIIANDARVLLQLDPLDARNDAAIADHLGPIQYALSDPKAARGMERVRDRETFAGNLRELWLENGWSRRQLARECRQVARKLGHTVGAPDRWQLMDYESGRRNAHPRSKVVLAAALGVGVRVLDEAC